MDINITLIVQMLVFAAFVWFTMTFVWPPLMKALEERQNKIADGLAAAERGRREFELAQQRAKDELKKAKADAADIVEKAHHRASLLIEEAKEDARLEVQRAARVATEQLAQEIGQARESLHKQVSELAVLCAEKILNREINDKENQALMDNLIEEI